MKVSIQINLIGKNWEDIEKKEQTFKNQDEVMSFAYRLSFLFNKEVRIEYLGNGWYFLPAHAENFLQN